MTTIGRLARELAIGAPLVHLQLVASRLYEEIRDELEQPPHRTAQRSASWLLPWNGAAARPASVSLRLSL